MQTTKLLTLKTSKIHLQRPSSDRHVISALATHKNSYTWKVYKRQLSQPRVKSIVSDCNINKSRKHQDSPLKLLLGKTKILQPLKSKAVNTWPPTKKERLNLSDKQLKEAVKTYFGKKPNDAYLHSSTPGRGVISIRHTTGSKHRQFSLCTL